MASYLNNYYPSAGDWLSQVSRILSQQGATGKVINPNTQAALIGQGLDKAYAADLTRRKQQREEDLRQQQINLYGQQIANQGEYQRGSLANQQAYQQMMQDVYDRQAKGGTIAALAGLPGYAKNIYGLYKDIWGNKPAPVPTINQELVASGYDIGIPSYDAPTDYGSSADDLDFLGGSTAGNGTPANTSPNVTGGYVGTNPEDNKQGVSEAKIPITSAPANWQNHAQTYVDFANAPMTSVPAEAIAQAGGSWINNLPSGSGQSEARAPLEIEDFYGTGDPASEATDGGGPGLGGMGIGAGLSGGLTALAGGTPVQIGTSVGKSLAEQGLNYAIPGAGTLAGMGYGLYNLLSGDETRNPTTIAQTLTGSGFGGYMGQQLLGDVMGSDEARGIGGAAGGAMTGATIGSIFPGVGTAIGAGVGALSGLAAQFLPQIGQFAEDAYKDVIMPAVEPVVDAAESVWSTVSDAASDVGDWFDDVFDW